MERNNASNDAPHMKPTSQWDHSHCVQVGDVFTDDYDAKIVVGEIHDNGSATVYVHEFRQTTVREAETQTWSEKELTGSLVDGNITRISDGLSHELATF